MTLRETPRYFPPHEFSNVIEQWYLITPKIMIQVTFQALLPTPPRIRIASSGQRGITWNVVSSRTKSDRLATRIIPIDEPFLSHPLDVSSRIDFYAFTRCRKISKQKSSPLVLLIVYLAIRSLPSPPRYNYNDR